MKKRVLLRWVLFSTASISGLAMCGVVATLQSASAASPAASASASALASASASANAPVGPPKREPPIERLDKQTIPTTVSPVPTLDEWKTAQVVDVDRRNYASSYCVVLLVREWLKVKCELSIGAIYQHSGDSRGVAFWIQPKPNIWENVELLNGGEMIFPLRVGDRRLLQFFEARRDPCIGIGFEPSVLVDETWIEGESAPTVVLE